jgi:hypothetical protein
LLTTNTILGCEDLEYFKGKELLLNNIYTSPDAGRIL